MPSIRVLRTPQFNRWFGKLRDTRARQIIADRMMRLAEGNPGSSRSLGNGLSELKIDFGPGYRLYYTKREETIVWLLCGGDKSTQSADIALARKLRVAIAGGDYGV